MSVCCKNSYISIFHTIKPEDIEEEYIETNEYKKEDEELNTMIETEITKNTKPEEQQVDKQSLQSNGSVRPPILNLQFGSGAS